MRWFKQILAFLSLSVIAIPALAETDHLKRSVVRVVTLAQTADGVVVVGHGTGFAVSPSDIVTNAHVVEDYLQLKAQGTRLRCGSYRRAAESRSTPQSRLSTATGTIWRW
jgi:predicted TIM-barrel enzyme